MSPSGSSQSSVPRSSGHGCCERRRRRRWSIAVGRGLESQGPCWTADWAELILRPTRMPSFSSILYSAGFAERSKESPLASAEVPQKSGRGSPSSSGPTPTVSRMLCRSARAMPMPCVGHRLSKGSPIVRPQVLTLGRSVTNFHKRFSLDAAER
jgi:hypothetical protein